MLVKDVTFEMYREILGEFLELKNRTIFNGDTNQMVIWGSPDAVTVENLKIFIARISPKQ